MTVLLAVWLCVYCDGVLSISRHCHESRSASVPSVCFGGGPPSDFPYINFMGTNLSNHSYINLSLVGEDLNGVQCRTDLITCCSNTEGPDRGDWYLPNGKKLKFSGDTLNGTFEVRYKQGVDVRRRGSQKISGLYRCEIETNAVNNQFGNETLYAGLYTNGGQ